MENNQQMKKLKLLKSSMNYFGSYETILPPILMSSGIIIGIIANILQSYQFISLSLIMAAITIAFAGSAMEITYLLILKRMEKVLLNTNQSLALSIVIIAVLMMLYFIVIGMPLVHYYESGILKKLYMSTEDKKKCIFDNPILSLITFGYGLSIYQACSGVNVIKIINNAINNLSIANTYVNA
ncbi:hypothetical protein Calag_1319 [Caldisphaera lagunensis DSM 15908]|uniref:Uncharacterized protein n=1 Tax=Caldisphaera lagunensis (strain DSM 15908 / JCM 11604 / ANMR 0165 / IC-154) TaxID=1056495 RepID=L0ADA1_CALLD|nr:hypothetical protein [Caldisphaera lagunensis]AFZ71030.1 hypothetical protein Calag_1319 [Caldisphaera lagunensis DSM 15908]